MKCLLCNFKSNKSIEVKDHYIRFHKVDLKNNFLKKIFYGKRCMRCQEFLPTSKFKKHDFLKHENGRNAVEEKPVSVTNIGTVTKFEITFQEHSSSYDFYNSESLVDEFLLNVKNRIERSNTDFFIRCVFLLENIQPPPTDDEQPLKNSWYWSTEPIQTKSFTGFVFFSIRESVLKRVINN